MVADNNDTPGVSHADARRRPLAPGSLAPLPDHRNVNTAWWQELWRRHAHITTPLRQRGLECDIEFGLSTYIVRVSLPDDSYLIIGPPQEPSSDHPPGHPEEWIVTRQHLDDHALFEVVYDSAPSTDPGAPERSEARHGGSVTHLIEAIDQRLTQLGLQPELPSAAGRPLSSTAPQPLAGEPRGLSGNADPASRYVYGDALLALTDRLTGTESHADAAALLHQILDPTDGLLERLSEFFEAAGEKAKEAEQDDGFDLSYDLADAAAELRNLGEVLHVAEDRMRELNPPPPAPRPSTAPPRTRAFPCLPSHQLSCGPHVDAAGPGHRFPQDSMTPARTDLPDFASGLAARLPDAWTSEYQRHAVYADQFPTTNQLWDIGHVAHIASTYVLAHDAVLNGPEDQRLYVSIRPRYPHQFVVAPLKPDDNRFKPHHFDGAEVPNGIAVPNDPVRAASHVSRRLLPRYEQALDELIDNAEDHPEPPHRAAPPQVSQVLTLTYYDDGALGAPRGSVPPDAHGTLFAHGFQYHPHQAAFLLPAAYGEDGRALRVQAVARKLATQGIGVNLRHATTAAIAPSTTAARPAMSSPTSMSTATRRR